MHSLQGVIIEHSNLHIILGMEVLKRHYYEVNCIKNETVLQAQGTISILHTLLLIN